MANTTHRRMSWLLFGPLCIGAGVLLGRLLPAPRPTWQHDNVAPLPAEREVGVPSLAPVVERVAPGVASVRALFAAVDAPSEAERTTPSLGVRTGTGFVVDPRGLVVTARHVVARATEITVWGLGSRPLRASMFGQDEATDLAVLRLQDVPTSLVALSLGDSQQARTGDWIFTIGDPFGFSQTVTTGVVSFMGRHLMHDDLKITTDFLQFSAQVNPGSSGCPVLDLQGRVVGVTTQAMESAQGISFAVPSHTLRWVLDQIWRNADGHVHRALLGITFATRTDVDGDGGRSDAVVLDSVAKGKPADRAGLQPGDTVLYFDDHRITDGRDLHERVTRAAPGTHASITVMREGRVLAPIDVVLDEVGQPSSDPGH